MDYEKKRDEQIEQYSNNALRFFLPEAHKYWMRKFVWPQVSELFGVKDHVDFYTAPVLESQGPIEILSVGSGDGQLEVAIVKRLIAAGRHDVRLHVTELSPVRQERTIGLIAREQVSQYFEYHIVDFNRDFIDGSFDLVFAHHVLHHIVELELLFSNIENALTPTGTFATIDMIGRNGHMRWPEALEYTEMAWNFLPDHWKYNFQLNEFHPEYVNWDCSNSGFEGIRSQDILPLLLKQFRFDCFAANGGFLDLVFDRGYGQSIDIECPRERALVDFLSRMNQLLLETGRIKPTMLFAHMRSLHSQRHTAVRVAGNMTPGFAVRPVS